MALDLTPLKQALKNKLGFETLQASATGKQIRIIGRLPANRVGDQIVFIDHVFNGWLERKKPGWTADISKPYFLHPQSRKVVWTWRFLFGVSGKDDTVDRHLPDIVNCVLSSPASTRHEIMEVPLVGASRDRNSLVRGRGVQSSEKAVVGPMAMVQMRGGGG